ncbi:hypothetical protein PV371_30245 [Streptomyces sp. TX20-6-3]|uniref:hypothetical protein n=1 Tax=Streptomyces sp. TX20-6-3 TaxID=3028705 RepID=UPI0029A60B42|nr:hypothetical protein [Streptomyces sp. TX20-6-3]MDX2563904.1 hypothetical protein [Streptomyces sp. TX20-6-3]
MGLLPFVDEHVVVVDGGVEELWQRLLVKVGQALSTGGGARYARVVGAVPRESGGVRPLGVGSEFPGFRVARLVPGRELALEGRHRFSSYSLVFRVEELAGGRCRLRAETRAVFPGAAGRVYRALVIGSGGHAFAMRRMMAGYRQP